jgi:hypothetical protein
MLRMYAAIHREMRDLLQFEKQHNKEFREAKEAEADPFRGAATDHKNKHTDSFTQGSYG